MRKVAFAIAAGLFLLAAFGVTMASVNLTDLGLVFFAGAFLLP